MYQERQLDAQGFLTSTRMGTEVYDVDQHKVGKVIEIRFASDTADEMTSAAESDLVGLHEVVRARLLRSGFIKIGTGFLRADRYVMADQITYANNEAVYLKVGRDSLIRA
jgi:hypothetical protein